MEIIISSGVFRMFQFMQTGKSKSLGMCKHFGVRNLLLLGKPERRLGWSEPEGPFNFKIRKSNQSDVCNLRRLTARQQVRKA